MAMEQILHCAAAFCVPVFVESGQHHKALNDASARKLDFVWTGS